MDRKFIGLFIVFFVMFAFFSVFVLARNQIQTFTQASEDKTPSASASVVLAWPLETKVGTQSTITAFVRSQSGKPISNHTVSFSSSIGSIQNNQGVSDDNGKVEALLLCTQQGIAEIDAIIDNATTIDQKITIECI